MPWECVFSQSERRKRTTTTITSHHKRARKNYCVYVERLFSVSVLWFCCVFCVCGSLFCFGQFGVLTQNQLNIKVKLRNQTKKQSQKIYIENERNNRQPIFISFVVGILYYYGACIYNGEYVWRLVSFCGYLHATNEQCAPSLLLFRWAVCFGVCRSRASIFFLAKLNCLLLCILLQYISVWNSSFWLENYRSTSINSDQIYRHLKNVCVSLNSIKIHISIRLSVQEEGKVNGVELKRNIYTDLPSNETKEDAKKSVLHSIGDLQWVKLKDKERYSMIQTHKKRDSSKYKKYIHKKNKFVVLLSALATSSFVFLKK